MTKDAVTAAYARISPLVRETPLEESAALSREGATVLLKLEHLQHTGSFKFRGASNRISKLTPDEAARGIVAASNGNHGLGVAAAARHRGIDAEIFVSSHVSPGKALRIERLGARLTRYGDDPLTAELAARRAAEQSGRVFISPYNDPEVIAGQGTIAVELPHVDAVFAAVGGGGLIGGIGAYLKEASPDTEVVGCWPDTSPVLLRCIEAGRIIDVPETPTLSESTAGGLEPESITLDLCRRVIDRAVQVSEEEILAAMHLVLQTEHWLIEGAAAVAVAAFLKDRARYSGKTVALILCGRNLSDEALQKFISWNG
jgi:threonine dehydratase